MPNERNDDKKPDGSDSEREPLLGSEADAAASGELSPFAGYTLVDRKEGGANSSIGPYGGVYADQHARASLFKRDTRNNKTRTSKVLAEAIAGDMLYKVFEILDGKKSTQYLAQVNLVQAHTDPDNQADVSPDETGDETYLQSFFIKHYQGDLWACAYRQYYREKYVEDINNSIERNTNLDRLAEFYRQEMIHLLKNLRDKSQKFLDDAEKDPSLKNLPRYKKELHSKETYDSAIQRHEGDTAATKIRKYFETEHQKDALAGIFSHLAVNAMTRPIGLIDSNSRTIISNFIKREPHLLEEFANHAARRLWIKDLGLHSANFGIQLSDDNQTLHIVSLDYGTALNKLGNTVRPFQRFQIGLPATKAYKHHFLEYDNDVITSENMAKAFIRIGLLDISTIDEIANDAIRKQATKLGITPLKAFCKSLGMSPDSYINESSQESIIQKIISFASQKLASRAQSLKQQGYALLLEHCIKENGDIDHGKLSQFLSEYPELLQFYKTSFKKIPLARNLNNRWLTSGEALKNNLIAAIDDHAATLQATPQELRRRQERLLRQAISLSPYHQPEIALDEALTRLTSALQKYGRQADDSALELSFFKNELKNPDRTKVFSPVTGEAILSAAEIAKLTKLYTDAITRNDAFASHLDEAFRDLREDFVLALPTLPPKATAENLVLEQDEDEDPVDDYDEIGDDSDEDEDEDEEAQFTDDEIEPGVTSSVELESSDGSGSETEENNEPLPSKLDSLIKEFYDVFQRFYDNMNIFAQSLSDFANYLDPADEDRAILLSFLKPYQAFNDNPFSALENKRFSVESLEIIHSTLIGASWQLDTLPAFERCGNIYLSVQDFLEALVKKHPEYPGLNARKELCAGAMLAKNYPIIPSQTIARIPLMIDGILGALQSQKFKNERESTQNLVLALKGLADSQSQSTEKFMDLSANEKTFVTDAIGTLISRLADIVNENKFSPDNKTILKAHLDHFSAQLKFNINVALDAFDKTKASNRVFDLAIAFFLDVSEHIRKVLVLEKINIPDKRLEDILTLVYGLFNTLRLESKAHKPSDLLVDTNFDSPVVAPSVNTSTSSQQDDSPHLAESILPRLSIFKHERPTRPVPQTPTRSAAAESSAPVASASVDPIASTGEDSAVAAPAAAASVSETSISTDSDLGAEDNSVITDPALSAAAASVHSDFSDSPEANVIPVVPNAASLAAATSASATPPAARRPAIPTGPLPTPPATSSAAAAPPAPEAPVVAAPSASTAAPATTTRRPAPTSPLPQPPAPKTTAPSSTQVVAQTLASPSALTVKELLELFIQDCARMQGTLGEIKGLLQARAAAQAGPTPTQRAAAPARSVGRDPGQSRGS